MWPPDLADFRSGLVAMLEQLDNLEMDRHQRRLARKRDQTLRRIRALRRDSEFVERERQATKLRMRKLRAGCAEPAAPAKEATGAP